MEFSVYATSWKTWPDHIPLRRVWNFDDAELSPNAIEALNRLETLQDPIRTIYGEVCWQGQALVELQDLQDLPLPIHGRFLNLGYLFCESLSVLRQVVLCATNGQVHAAFAALRSSLEAMTHHYWWKRRLTLADSFEPFYDWLLGQAASRSFAQIMNDTLTDLEHPPQAMVFDRLKEVYGKLCSYSHKAVMDEALITVRGGNATVTNDQELHYWLSLIHATQRCMLDVAVLTTPLALFPVDLYRKFGFNGPVGVFLDKSSAHAIQKGIGRSAYEAYRIHFAALEPPREQLNWLSQQADLTDEEILATWHDEIPGGEKSDVFEDKVAIRASLMKANTRALLWSFSYLQETAGGRPSPKKRVGT